MKRLLALLLALAALLSLTACQFRTSEERKEMRAQMDYAKEAPAIDSFDYALDDGTSLEAITLYDDHGLTITLLGVYETADEYILPLRIHNTSDGWFSVYANQCSINGWLVMGSLYEQVCMNGMADTQLTLAKSDFPQAAGPVGEIEVSMGCSTTGDGGYYEFSHTIFFREVEESSLDALLLAEDDGLRLSLLDCREDDYALYFDLAVENTSDRSLSLEADTAPPVINGQESTFTCWDSVWLDAGTKSVMTLELSWYDLEESGITSAGDIQTFSVELELYRSSASDYISLELDGETIQRLLDN